MECFLHFIIEATLCIEFIFFGSVLIFCVIDQTWKDLQILRKEGGLLLSPYYHNHKLPKLQGHFTPAYLWYVAILSFLTAFSSCFAPAPAPAPAPSAEAPQASWLSALSFCTCPWLCLEWNSFPT